MLHMFYLQRMLPGPPFHNSKRTRAAAVGDTKSQALRPFWRHLHSGSSRGFSVLRPLHL